MKTKLFPVFTALGAALLFAGCSTINSRIQEKSAVFSSLDPATQAQIKHGDVGLGFTPDMVYMALGQPDATRHRTSADGVAVTWIYDSNYYDAAYVGYHRWGGWGPRGMYRMYWGPGPFYGPYYGPFPSDDIRVTFQNGRVVSIDQART
jgi:hypothetical protein